MHDDDQFDYVFVCGAAINTMLEIENNAQLPFSLCIIKRMNEN